MSTSDVTNGPASRLDGRRLLVVGATSGVGRALAVAAAAAGARVVAVGRRADRLDGMVAEGHGDLVGLPADVRVAVEFRHATWFTDETRRLLERHGSALCLADRRGLRTPLWRTADWTYLRFHEGRATPPPCYGRTTLATWTERIRDGWGADADAWAYFNNDPRGCAPRDAARFGALAARAGGRR